MFKITLGVEGMKCVKCEAHMEKALQNAFAAEKVTASHEKKEVVFFLAEDIAEEKLRSVVADAGYECTHITKEPQEKKGVFGLFRG